MLAPRRREWVLTSAAAAGQASGGQLLANSGPHHTTHTYSHSPAQGAPAGPTLHPAAQPRW
eukprot:scaffold9593_cov146-Isochrysis_galbana.AAC.3